VKANRKKERRSWAQVETQEKEILGTSSDRATRKFPLEKAQRRKQVAKRFRRKEKPQRDGKGRRDRGAWQLARVEGGEFSRGGELCVRPSEIVSGQIIPD